jgi:hypothetical protein
MSEPDTKTDLMPALGRMVQGLSALFWGLPLSLIIGVQTARTDWLSAFGPLPILAATTMLLYGVHQLRFFQPHERVWISALDRARLPAMVNLGMAPFLYWWHRMPETAFFSCAVAVLVVSALVFLLNLNLLVCQLSAMLPDITLRQEARFFTSMNRFLLAAAFAYIALDAFLSHLPALAHASDRFGWGPFFAGLITLAKSSPLIYLTFDQIKLWTLGLLVLLPVAMTMALLWKIKETIMASVFQSTSH